MSPLKLISADWEVPENVVALVTTRVGGESQSPYQSLNLADHVGDQPETVKRNRNLLAAELDSGLHWQWLTQIHSNQAVRISNAESNLQADGLSTAVPGLVCGVMTADCLSVFIADEQGTEVAIAHAGWRGLCSGIIENTVGSMHTPPERLWVWLGPAIGPCHFEVGAEVREQFLAVSRQQKLQLETEDCFRATPVGGKFMADLFALARLRLSRLRISRIRGGGECTFCQPERYYSFRREDPTGRQLSLIYLRPTGSH